MHNKDYVNLKVGSVSFNLKKFENFDWLNKIGQAFCVFDQQDSGNLCFGVKTESGKRLFVKHAGTRTTEYNGKIEDAVSRLKNAIPNYLILENDTLIKLTDHFSTDNGYSAVFEWFDGDCLHDHWNFDKCPKYTHPESVFYRFKRLPIEKRLMTLKLIYEFHEHVERKNYQAVDFYDGSILYNFEHNQVKICDIDLYAKKPYINKLCWGSKRFKAPEDFIQGEILDERTNVYNMGATAFSFIGGELDRTLEKWEGSDKQYQVAKIAVSDNKTERYSSVEEFYREWKNASK